MTAPSSRPTPVWLKELKRQLGPAVVGDPDVIEAYAVDWTGRFRGAPAALLRPRDVAGVMAVLEASSRHGFAVVPQGGNTGLVGATMAPEGAALLNLGHLDDLGEPDRTGSMVAGAGATIAAVQESASRRDLVFGLDMGSRDSATVGGALATNAGGLLAWHWGRMRSQVTAVELVLADGSRVSTLDDRGGAGLDPVGVLAGSEGTLGVVTAARLQLRPPPGPTLVVLAGFDRLSRILEFLAAAPPLMGAEVFRRAEMEMVTRHTGRGEPLGPSPWYVLVELEERHAGELPAPAQAVTGRELWVYRDRITESLATQGVIHKFDVVVSSSRLEQLVERLAARLEPDRLFVFGHVLMDDFHLNVAPAHPGGAVPGTVDEAVYAAVEEAGGRVAGEHGAGRAKGDRLRASLPPGHRRIADSIKRALDPEGRLNPGVGAARL